jgi:hypothetical protein
MDWLAGNCGHPPVRCLPRDLRRGWPPRDGDHGAGPVAGRRSCHPGVSVSRLLALRPTPGNLRRRFALVAETAPPAPVDHARGTTQDYERDHKIEPEHHYLLSERSQRARTSRFKRRLGKPSHPRDESGGVETMRRSRGDPVKITPDQPDISGVACWRKGGGRPPNPPSKQSARSSRSTGNMAGRAGVLSPQPHLHGHAVRLKRNPLGMMNR